MGSHEANEVLVWNLETGTEDCKLPFGKPTDELTKIKWIESIGNDKVLVGAELSRIVVIFDEENQVNFNNLKCLTHSIINDTGGQA